MANITSFSCRYVPNIAIFSYSEFRINDKYGIMQYIYFFLISIYLFTHHAPHLPCHVTAPTIQRSFRKCGITIAIDGSEDDQINIHGLNNYQVPRSIDSRKPEDHPDSDECSNSDSNDSDPSEASDSDSVVSFEQVIID